MNDSKTDGLDALLKAYSIISEREDDWLSQAIMKNAEADNALLDPGKVQALMERFSDAKPFGDLVLQAISQKSMSKDDVNRELDISNEVMEKVLTHTALPNIVPLRKMIALLRYLKIPLALALEGMRISLERFKVEEFPDWVPSPTMRRGKQLLARSTARSEEISRETLRRDLEVYINRLKEEGV